MFPGIEKKALGSFLASAFLHAGAGAGLLGFAMLSPELPAKKGLSALPLELSLISDASFQRPDPVLENTKNSSPVSVSSVSSAMSFTNPDPHDIPHTPSVIPATSTGSGQAPARIQNSEIPAILDSGLRRNDREEDNDPSLDPGIREAESTGPLQPLYPWLSRKKGEEGKVILTVRVDAHGKVSDCRVAQSSGFSLLDRAAQDAIAAATFSPATRGGVAVISEKQWLFEFRLEGGSFQ